MYKKLMLIIILILSSIVASCSNESSNESSLIWASSRGDLEAVKYLVENGADINAKNGGGETALIVASDLEVVKYLVEHGANVNAKNKNGNTPLILAPYGGEEIRKILLEAGAK